MGTPTAAPSPSWGGRFLIPLNAENREAAVQSLALADERFKAGAGSTLEVRDAQLKLTQAELALLGNRVDVEIARFALMRAMGTLSPGESK